MKPIQSADFEIIYVSSESSSYPASNLRATSSLFGWTSNQFATFPVILIFGLQKITYITNLKIQSHAFKITTKIEIQISEENLKTDDANWVSLGYATFSNNLNSTIQVIESKNIEIKQHLMFLKLILFYPFNNFYNAEKQVGLKSIVLFKMDKENPKSKEIKLMKSNEQNKQTEESEFVFKTKQILEFLELEKQTSIIKRDFEKCQILKNEIDKIKEFIQIFEVLKNQLKIEIQMENFKEAAKIELKMEKIRADVFGFEFAKFQTNNEIWNSQENLNYEQKKQNGNNKTFESHSSVFSTNGTKIVEKQSSIKLDLLSHRETNKIGFIQNQTYKNSKILTDILDEIKPGILSSNSLSSEFSRKQNPNKMHLKQTASELNSLKLVDQNLINIPEDIFENLSNQIVQKNASNDIILNKNGVNSNEIEEEKKIELDLSKRTQDQIKKARELVKLREREQKRKAEADVIAKAEQEAIKRTAEFSKKLFEKEQAKLAQLSLAKKETELLKLEEKHNRNLNQNQNLKNINIFNSQKMPINEKVNTSVGSVEIEKQQREEQKRQINAEIEAEKEVKKQKKVRRKMKNSPPNDLQNNEFIENSTINKNVKFTEIVKPQIITQNNNDEIINNLNPNEFVEAVKILNPQINRENEMKEILEEEKRKEREEKIFEEERNKKSMERRRKSKRTKRTKKKQSKKMKKRE